MSADDHRKPRRAARLLHFAVMLLLLMAFGWVVEHLLLDEEHLRHLQTIQKEAADGVAAFSPTDLIALYVQAYVSDYKHSPMFVVPEAFIIVLAQLSDQPWPAVIAILVQLVVGFAITVGICFRFRAFYRLKGLDRLWLFTVWLPLGSVIFGSVAAVPVWIIIWLSLVIFGGIVAFAGLVTHSCLALFGSYTILEKGLELRFHHLADKAATTAVRHTLG